MVCPGRWGTSMVLTLDLKYTVPSGTEYSTRTRKIKYKNDVRWGGATISLFSHLERAMPTIFSVGKFPVEACDFLVPIFFSFFVQTGNDHQRNIKDIFLHNLIFLQWLRLLSFSPPNL